MESSAVRLAVLETKYAQLQREFHDYRQHVKELKEKDEQALIKQAEEYERRLSELNNAHETAVQVQKEQLRISTWEEFLREYREWRDSVNKFMQSASGRDLGTSEGKTILEHARAQQIKTLTVVISLAFLALATVTGFVTVISFVFKLWPIVVAKP